MASMQEPSPASPNHKLQWEPYRYTPPWGLYKDEEWLAKNYPGLVARDGEEAKTCPHCGRDGDTKWFTCRQKCFVCNNKSHQRKTCGKIYATAKWWLEVFGLKEPPANVQIKPGPEEIVLLQKWNCVTTDSNGKVDWLPEDEWQIPGGVTFQGDGDKKVENAGKRSSYQETTREGHVSLHGKRKRGDDDDESNREQPPSKAFQGSQSKGTEQDCEHKDKKKCLKSDEELRRMKEKLLNVTDAIRKTIPKTEIEERERMAVLERQHKEKIAWAQQQEEEKNRLEEENKILRKEEAKKKAAAIASRISKKDPSGKL